MGNCAAVSASRSRSDLRGGLCEAGEGDGYPTGALGTAVALAASLHRAGGRHDSARVPGSRDRMQRSQFASPSPKLRGLLSSEPYTPRLTEGHARVTPRPSARNRADRRDPRSWWAPSSVRTSRRLNAAATADSGTGCESCPWRLIRGRPSVSRWALRFGRRVRAKATLRPRLSGTKNHSLPQSLATFSLISSLPRLRRVCFDLNADDFCR